MNVNTVCMFYLAKKKMRQTTAWNFHIILLLINFNLSLIFICKLINLPYILKTIHNHFTTKNKSKHDEI
jgi:hypothetical protein